MNTTIASLATELCARRAQGQPGATLYLGAGASRSSGVPDWRHLSESICGDLKLTVGADPSDAVEEYFRDRGPRHPQRTLLLRDHLLGRQPSKGFAHLTQLVEDSLVRYILTTNWDCLVETALYRRMAPEHVKVLIRGELGDDLIAESLEQGGVRVYVVKLHGDAAAGIYLMRREETAGFSDRLLTTLGRLVGDHCTIVGQSGRDVDTLQLILGQRPSSLVTVVTPERDERNEIQRMLGRAGTRWISGHERAVQISGVEVEVGDFDVFFSQLDLAVRQRLLNEPAAVTRLQNVEQAILTKERRGSGYINYARSSDMLTRFWSKVRARRPDVLLFVYDPEAPGGVELQRRLPASEVPCPAYVVPIRERTASRRYVESDVPAHPAPASVNQVIVVDSISFSGGTLRLVVEQAREWFPHAVITAGALIISQALHAQLGEEEWSRGLIYEDITDRFEIFFPWGVTQLTSTLERHFPVLDATADKIVTINRRVWGAIERFAEEDLSLGKAADY